MKPYPAYKPTGLAWLLEVPREWEMLHIFQVAHETCCKNVGCKEMNVLSLSFGTIKRKQDIYAGLSPTDFATYQIVEPGNTILRLTDLQNDKRSLRTGLVKERGIITSAYTCVVPHGNAEYLHYALHTLDLHKIYYGLGGGVRQSIGFNEIRQLKIPVPPPAEQEAIVAYLDEKTAKIDRLIELKEREIKLLNEKKQAVISKVVTRGLDPNAELVDGDVPGWPKIPKHWQRKSLKTVLDTPMCDGPHTTPSFVKEGVPFVSAEGAHDGKIFVKDCRGLISRELHEEYCKRLKPQKGDIFIVKSGSTTGKTVMVDVDDEFSVWSPLALVRVGEKIDARYLFNFLTSVYFQREVQDNWSFGTQPNIGMGVLKNLYVLVPPREEQVGIVRYVDALSAKTDKAIAAVMRQIGLLKEYRTRLISDAVTGRIDLRKL